MRKFVLLLIVFLFAGIVDAQDMRNTIEIELPTTDVMSHAETVLSVKVTNLTDHEIYIQDITIQQYSDEIQFTWKFPIVIPSNSSIDLTFDAKFEQNIAYNVPVLFEIDSRTSEYSELEVLTFNSVHENEYYSSTFDLFGNDLFNELTNLVSGHTSFTYKEARNIMYGELDNFDGWIETVYIGRKLETDGIPKVNITHVNTEHTWPQSLGAKNEPQLSDMFHIYPSDENANAKRGNSPFGNVVGGILWEEAESKLGQNESGYLVFEPRDVHKGNAARSMLYFATRYGNMNNFLTSQEPTLREWMDFDAVDEKENRRNELIYKYQKNRNPYIDHPEFLDRIYSVSGEHDLPAKRGVVSSGPSVIFHFEPGSEDVQAAMQIYNSGNTDIQLKEIYLKDPSSWLSISGVDFPESLPPRGLSEITYSIDISTIISESSPVQATFELRLSDTTLTFFVEANLLKISVADEAASIAYLGQNYPNPMEDMTTIEFFHPSANYNNVSLEFSDVLGRVVYDASDAISFDSNGRGTLLIDAGSLKQYGNVLYYTLRCADYTATRFLLLN